MDILLKNGYVVDAANDFEGIADILVNKGKIVKCAPDIAETADVTVDCAGKTVIPGICDMHVHFRDPGQTHKEDIFTGCEAAVAGGVTAVACMPNTVPVVDNAETVKYIVDKAKGAKARVYPIGCITKGQKGEELCDYAELKAAGCVAVSDDGKPVLNARLLSRAMVKAHYAGLRVISHCEDPQVIQNGIMNSGEVSKELGVPGMHRISEDISTAREIVMAGDLEMPIHIAHVSTATSMLLVRLGARYGAMVTSETCPHYFMLTDEKLRLRDADYRMNPPLRTEDDVTAITEAVCDGTIDCIVTDHAPHAPEEKADFEKAPNGVVGLETSLAATLTELYHRGKISLKRIVRLMCVNPRKILGIAGGSLGEGDIADITVFDPDEEWVVDPEKLHSKSKNTCFKGMKLKGRVKMTIVDGKIVYEDK
ncbi:MAG: dihydroorotase [Lachnospiraceae bacterium]|nr:dihydroorotase [Ruminococcus sp.]MCM1275818.1 dihydroorotase [Lachnospiraceae bacterium]